jgi:hypothetical protein
MKNRSLAILGGAGLLLGILVLPGLPQEPQRYLVYECVSSAENAEAFEAGMVKEIALYSKYGLPFGWAAYSTDDYRYFFMIPIENSGSIDKINAAFEEAAKKAGAEYKELEKTFTGTYDHMSLNVIARHPKLSFAPEKPRVPGDQAEFYHWSFFYIKPGYEDKIMELAKEFLELCKAKGAVDAYNFFVGELGRDLPIALSAGWDGNVSMEDLERNNEEFWKTLGEEGKALWAKGETYCRKVENIFGRYRPDLSLIPEK